MAFTPAAGLMMSTRCGDMEDLLAQEAGDVRAAEAIALFCYQAKKWIGAYSAVMSGIDSLVFAGGIGENAPMVRARIYQGLGFLDIGLSEARNAINAAVISDDSSRVRVRVMRTDEAVMIVQAVAGALARVSDSGSASLPLASISV